MRIIQGATIFGSTDESMAGPKPTGEAIAGPALSDEDLAKVQRNMAAMQGPWTPPPKPVPVFWTIYNRWTGKHVCDLLGNEHADPDRSIGFPSEAAALQFARGLRGKPIETALAQPPPDDPAHCYKCGTANAHGTVTCNRCHQTIEVATSWVQVHVYDAQGRWAGPTIYV